MYFTWSSEFTLTPANLVYPVPLGINLKVYDENVAHSVDVDIIPFNHERQRCCSVIRMYHLVMNSINYLISYEFIYNITLFLFLILFTIYLSQCLSHSTYNKLKTSMSKHFQHLTELVYIMF